jgi:hypothetical protein
MIGIDTELHHLQVLSCNTMKGRPVARAMIVCDSSFEPAEAHRPDPQPPVLQRVIALFSVDNAHFLLIADDVPLAARVAAAAHLAAACL